MNQEKIGKYISECRKKQKMTQEQLAEKLDVTSKSVSRWENGKTMPDLSLLKSLSKELNITINDLLSGETNEKEDYINSLEENFVMLASNIEKKDKRKIKYLNIISIIVIILSLFLMGKTIYDYYEIDVKYDSRVVDCNIENNKIVFKMHGQSMLNTYHTIKDLNGNKLYFFHSTLNLYNKKRSHYDYFETTARLLDKEKYIFGSWTEIDIDNDVEKIFVYYTDESIKKIEKATKTELNKIIDNAYLICEK